MVIESSVGMFLRFIMPIYTYRCENWFKGSGFYATDNRSPSGMEESRLSEDHSEPKTETSADVKESKEKKTEKKTKKETKRE